MSYKSFARKNHLFLSLLPWAACLALNTSCDFSGSSGGHDSEILQLRKILEGSEDDALRARAQRGIDMLQDRRIDPVPFVINAAVVNQRNADNLFFAFSYVTEKYTGGMIVIRCGNQEFIYMLSPEKKFQDNDLAFRTVLVSEQEWNKAALCSIEKLEGGAVLIRVKKKESNSIFINRKQVQDEEER